MRALRAGNQERSSIVTQNPLMLKLQNIPNWLKHTGKCQAWKEPITDSKERQERAKAKYGRGYKPNPPKWNRQNWAIFLERNQSLAEQNYRGTNSAVLRLVKARETAWKAHPQGGQQRKLLQGSAGLKQKGVIYALVNERSFFRVGTAIYVGQTSDSVIGRTRHHFDKVSSGGSGLETIVIEAMKATHRWWQSWVMIPLESIPLPSGMEPGSQKYLEVFRASTIVREQAWIRHLQTGFPHGPNREVHQ